MLKHTLLLIVILILSACNPTPDDYLDGCKLRVSDVNKFDGRKTPPCKCTDLPL